MLLCWFVWLILRYLDFFVKGDDGHFFHLFSLSMSNLVKAIYISSFHST